MTRSELERAVTEIIGIGDVDPEQAHIKEDALCSRLVMLFAPDWARAEMVRLGKGQFPRWSA